jgi:hypothetical protein
MIEEEFPGCSAASITSQLDNLSASSLQGASPADGEGLQNLHNSLSNKAASVFASSAAANGTQQHIRAAAAGLSCNTASTMAPEAWAAGAPAAAVAAAATAGRAVTPAAAAAQLLPLPPVDPWRLPLKNEQQRVVLSNLLKVRALVQGTLARLEQQQTHEFLNACSAGNVDLILTVS